MTKRVSAQSSRRRVLFHHLGKALGEDGFFEPLTGDFYAYPLASACYPDAIRAEEWGILPPKQKPEQALLTVKDGIGRRKRHSEPLWLTGRESVVLDLVYQRVFGVVRAEYERRFLAKHPEVQRKLEDAEKRYLDE